MESDRRKRWNNTVIWLLLLPFYRLFFQAKMRYPFTLVFIQLIPEVNCGDKWHIFVCTGPSCHLTNSVKALKGKHSTDSEWGKPPPAWSFLDPLPHSPEGMGHWSPYAIHPLPVKKLSAEVLAWLSVWSEVQMNTIQGPTSHSLGNAALLTV